jgi:Flp pilus assembly protein TadG
MYRWGPAAHNRLRRDTATRHYENALQELVPPPDIEKRGVALRPATWKLPVALRRWRDEERGAEMVEFALVVVLLIMLLYGIITYGLILAAQATVTQAAADGARSGIVASSTAKSTAEAQAGSDVSWMGKGTCGEKGSGTVITCTATPEPCPSNTSNECLSVTVIYNYSQAPLFPEMPGLGVITPSTISSTDVLQMSTPSS